MHAYLILDKIPSGMLLFGRVLLCEIKLKQRKIVIFSPTVYSDGKSTNYKVSAVKCIHSSFAPIGDVVISNWQLKIT